MIDVKVDKVTPLDEIEQFCIYLLAFDDGEFLPSLIQYFGLDKVSTFCSLFGGERIRVPTIGELNSSIFSFKLLKEKSITKITWRDLQTKYNLSNKIVAQLKINFKLFEDKLSNIFKEVTLNE